MKKILFIFFICFTSSVYAQDKYLIYFKDKGSFNQKSLSKSVDKEQLAKQFLSERSIERRIKSLGENYFNIEDCRLRMSIFKIYLEVELKLQID